ncbi:MAG TPA: hypothetical protein VHW02_01935 [Rhizomicrobium sp.]|jgi:hypothetical protein|nr:hypothetical protein [Rhizomicrobium sp.]
MGFFQGKSIASIIVVLFAIALMIREGQFGSAIATFATLLNGPQQTAELPVTPTSVQPSVTPPVQTADIAPDSAPAPQPEPSAAQPQPQAPASDPNKYVLKADDHLWEVQNGQMVQTDELPKGTVVEKIGPYQSATNYTEIAELDTDGVQMKTGVIFSQSIEPVVDVTDDDETLWVSDAPSTTFLTIQSVRIINKTAQSQPIRQPALAQRRSFMTIQRMRYAHTGCCQGWPRRPSPYSWDGARHTAPVSNFRSTYSGGFHGHFHSGGHR